MWEVSVAEWFAHLASNYLALTSWGREFDSHVGQVADLSQYDPDCLAECETLTLTLQNSDSVSMF